MTIYKTLSEVIRDGLELKIQCNQCPFTERADPQDALSYIGGSRALNRAGVYPEFTLERTVDGLECPVCGARNFKVEAIKPLQSSEVDEE